MIKKILATILLVATSATGFASYLPSGQMVLKGLTEDDKFGQNMRIHANALFVTTGDKRVYWYNFGDDKIRLYQDASNSEFISESFGVSMATSSKKIENGEIYNYCLVGDPDGGENGAGAVHLFGSKVVDGVRVPIGEPVVIVHDEIKLGDRFGYGLVILENTLYIGAPSANNGTGTIYQYTIDPHEGTELTVKEEELDEWMRTPSPDYYQGPITYINYGQYLKMIMPWGIHASVNPGNETRDMIRIEDNQSFVNGGSYGVVWNLKDVYPNSLNILALPPFVEDSEIYSFKKAFYSEENTGKIYTINYDDKYDSYQKGVTKMIIEDTETPSFGKALVTRNSPVIDNYDGKGGYNFYIAGTHFQSYGTDESHIAKYDPLAIFSENFLHHYVDYCEKGKYEVVDTTFHEIDLDEIELNEKRAAVGVENEKLYTYLKPGASPIIVLQVYDLTCPEVSEESNADDDEIESVANGKAKGWFIKDAWNYLLDENN